MRFAPRGAAVPCRRRYGIAAVSLIGLILVGAIVVVSAGGSSGTGRAGPRSSPHDLLAGLAGVVPSVAPSPSPSPAPRPATSAQLAACYDGTCRITVVGHARIRLSSRYGLPGPLSINVSDSTVSLRSAGGGGSLTSSIAGGGAAILNNLTVEVVSVSGSTAVLSLYG